MQMFAFFKKSEIEGGGMSAVPRDCCQWTAQIFFFKIKEQYFYSVKTNSPNLNVSGQWCLYCNNYCTSPYGLHLTLS